MLIQYVKELSPMLSACQAAAIQIANFIQMKGTDASSVLLSKAFARSFAVAAIIATRCKVCAFCLRSLLLFARGCAFALARCLRLFICRLRCFYAFAILCTPCTLSRVHVACIAAAFVAASFVLPPFGESTTRRGKGGGTAGGKPPAAVGAFYMVRSPSASRCNFSATR